MKAGRVRVNGAEHDVIAREDGSLQTDSGLELDQGDVEWLPPVHGTVVCAALNYREQLAELAPRFSKPPHGQPPKTPVLFIKPENTLTGHGRPVQVPDGIASVQPGPALAVVVGRTACRVSAGHAMDFVKGYTLFNDFSLPEDSYYRPPVRSKCTDTWGPLGPYVVGVDEVPDVSDLELHLSINGELKQSGSTSHLVWPIPVLMEFITGFMTLHENDILVTGFPAGRVDASVGDQVRVEVDSIGYLDSRVVSESEYLATAPA